MRPLFTIHAGEFVVGDFLEKKFKNLRIWIPSKDTGIDLLVTDKKNRKTVSLQVKFSRDFLSSRYYDMELQESLKATGWWTIKREKLAKSNADYWVLVVVGYSNKNVEYIIMKPKDLLKRFDVIHSGKKILQTYMWITEDGKCWETRGLKKDKQKEMVKGVGGYKERNFTRYLNNWSALERLNNA